MSDASVRIAGGIVALNRPVSLELAMLLSGQFVEVLFAPGFDETGLEMLKQKPSIRILHDKERRRPSAGERDYKRKYGLGSHVTNIAG